MRGLYFILFLCANIVLSIAYYIEKDPLWMGYIIGVYVICILGVIAQNTYKDKP